MDIIQNIKSMNLNQFLSLQVFEGLYILALAFLPFLLAVRVIAYIILAVVVIVTVLVGYRLLTLRHVNPEGKVVLITGCDSGFGNACARRLNAAGYTVVAACLDDTSEGAQRLMEMANGHMIVIKLDLTDDDSVESCKTKLKTLCGNHGMWSLVNNAGVCRFGDVEFSSLESYRQVMEVNIFGTLRITKACLPLLRAGKGRVVNITGSSGLVAPPGQSAFSIAEFGLEAMSDSLRMEMSPFNMEKLENCFAEMRNNSGDLLSAYGEDHLDKQLSQFTELSKSTASSLGKVIDSIEDAIGNEKPSSHYLVDGGNQLIDLGNVLVRCRQFIPPAVHDYLVSRMYRNKSMSCGQS
ncbi:D-beta-hydroxybutyrate dehydrogenase, mitochondrial [Plakobranchus ocellatus]|uniref:D-beta-hydroxybutyrate dehydrogenase, mitochondrial n=1 Tax=Plakobranchus ocellatus TaxID=259542 RepID=A0AAV4CMK9_9GAST|nr:D-beta-hydroxybutyrate dehydrogenase, mitochondrial [Plakobranchus ocellatus]